MHAATISLIAIAPFEEGTVTLFAQRSLHRQSFVGERATRNRTRRTCGSLRFCGKIAQQVFDRRSAVRLYRIFAPEHSVVNLGSVGWVGGWGWCLRIQFARLFVGLPESGLGEVGAGGWLRTSRRRPRCPTWAVVSGRTKGPTLKRKPAAWPVGDVGGRSSQISAIV